MTKKMIAVANIGINMTTGRPLFAKGAVIPDNHPQIKDWERYKMVKEIDSTDDTEADETNAATELQFSIPIKADAPSAPPTIETDEMKATRQAARTLQTKDQEAEADKSGQVKDINRASLAAKVADNAKKSLTEDEKKKNEDSVEKASQETEKLKAKEAKPAEEVGGGGNPPIPGANPGGDAQQTKAIETKPVTAKPQDKEAPKTTPKSNTEK